MQQQLPEPKNELLCPSCGSNDIIEENDEIMHSTLTNKPLIRYKCNCCKDSFIPATIIKQSSLQENIEKWSKKVRLQEGNNECRSWASDQIEYIIIRKNK